MEAEGEIKFDPASVVAVTPERSHALLSALGPILVEDSASFAKVTLESLWTQGERGTVFVWLRHFG